MRVHTAAALSALVFATSVAKAERDEREDRFERHGQFETRTLTNRADLISGGDALVEVRVPYNVPLDRVKLRLNGKDVTRSFVTDSGAHTLRGVLTGLREGRNAFVAE